MSNLNLDAFETVLCQKKTAVKITISISRYQKSKTGLSVAPEKINVLQFLPSAKVMFSQACVCPQGGCLLPGGRVSQHTLRQTPPPPGRDGHCCGRYASYWNAFLFNNLFAAVNQVFRCKSSSRRIAKARLH